LTGFAAVGDDRRDMEHAAAGRTETQAPPKEAPGNARAPLERTIARLQRGGNRATARTLQRVLQVRPPGRGEASAYGRRQELIDRLNRMSPAMEYFLRDDERTMGFAVIDEEFLTPFDRRMREFMSPDTQLIPMRLITREGYVGGAPLRMDSLQEGYVDLDDLLASSDLGMQMILIHFLTERSRVPNYARRIGTPMPFDAPHRAGRDAEAQHLRDLIGDDSINYVYEERRDPANPATSRYVIGFRSRRERYWVFEVYANRPEHGVRASTLFVEMPDKRRLSVEELIAERAAAAAPVAPVPAGP
jgi:hypothetical protein